MQAEIEGREPDPEDVALWVAAWERYKPEWMLALRQDLAEETGDTRAVGRLVTGDDGYCYLILSDEEAGAAPEAPARKEGEAP